MLESCLNLTVFGIASFYHDVVYFGGTAPASIFPWRLRKTISSDRDLTGKGPASDPMLNKRQIGLDILFWQLFANCDVLMPLL